MITSGGAGRGAAAAAVTALQSETATLSAPPARLSEPLLLLLLPLRRACRSQLSAARGRPLASQSPCPLRTKSGNSSSGACTVTLKPPPGQASERLKK